MDDSERSYGYSEDIYHGKKGPDGKTPGHESSYEVADKESGLESDDPSPLEEAMHLVDEDEVEGRTVAEKTTAPQSAEKRSADREAEDAGKLADGDAAETVTDVEGKPPKESSALG